jgi:hypothetical protein
VPPAFDVLSFQARATRLAGQTRVRLAAFSILSLVANWTALSTAGALNSYRDAQYFTLFEETARISVARFHELPLWNPYYCGGIYALGTPSARFVSPTFLLTLLFGTLRADALIALLMCVVGLEGAYRFARARGTGALGAAFGAPLFALCGFFARSASFEWINFYGFELIPWALLGFRHGLQGSVRGAVLAALVVATMIGFGGTYAAPLTLLAAAVEVLGALGRWVRRSPRRPAPVGRLLAMAAMIGLLAAGASAIRLWPVGETLASAPRLLGGTDGNSIRTLTAMLFGGGSDDDVRGQFLIGAFAIPVVVLGLTERRAIAIAIQGVAWAWLALGYAWSPSLFAVLRTIPPYTMLRSPERFLVLFALVSAVLAAVGIGFLERWMRRAATRGTRARRTSRIVFVVALGLLVVDTGVLTVNDNRTLLGRELFRAPPVLDREFAQARGNRWLASYYPAASRGTLSCFDDYQVPESPALRGDLEAEEFLADKNAGHVERRSWSPSRIRLHVDASRDARLIVNQNWHGGWHSNVGRVVSDSGRLALDLPPGTHEVELTFRSRSAIGGGLATLLALGAAVVLWARARKVDRLEGRRAWATAFGLTLLPLAAAGLVAGLIHEPGPLPTPLMTPGGEPMVADAPPAGARHLGVHFEQGIVLEAARLVLPSPRNDQTLLVELDWKLDKPAPGALGIFVHIDAPDGEDSVNVDHVALSGAATLESLPVGPILRDETPPIVFPERKSPAPRTFKIYVGLWRARRDGSRLTILDTGSAESEDNRVFLGSFTMP